jgi:hypothetical protein
MKLVKCNWDQGLLLDFFILHTKNQDLNEDNEKKSHVKTLILFLILSQLVVFCLLGRLWDFMFIFFLHKNKILNFSLVDFLTSFNLCIIQKIVEKSF